MTTMKYEAAATLLEASDCRPTSARVSSTSMACLTNTATLHALAWKETFDAFLLRRAIRRGARFVPFDAALDYGRHVDGKPRLDGVRAFLASRRIELPHEEVMALGERKNELVLELLRREGVEPYEGSVRFVRAARERAGLRLAVVSSSANCARRPRCGRPRRSLRAARRRHLHAQRTASAASRPRTRISRRPQPFACSRPRRPSSRTHSPASPPARAGGFGFVVGVDRAGRAEAL